MTYTQFCQDMCGYTPQTTFWDDFSIADRFGVAAIRDTYNRAFKSWRNNTTYITELSLVLNHKLWNHYNQGHTEFAKVYDELWRKCDNWCCDNLKGDDAEYYYRITD